MQTREMAELATLAAEHGALLIEGPAEIPPSAVEQYWLSSKYRLDAWGRALKRFNVVMAMRPAETQEPTCIAVLEEIMASELLTRVWSGVLCAFDRRRQQCEFEPIARSVFLGHMEARNRALRMLMHAPGIRLEDAVALNHLRRRVERWVDLLIGRLSLSGDCHEFAHDPARSREFTRDLREQPDLTAETSWRVTLASLRTAFADQLASACPHAELNSRVGAAVLGSFPSEVFDSTSQFHTLWSLRLMNTANDVSGMIASLQELESPRRDRPTHPFNRLADG